MIAARDLDRLQRTVRKGRKITYGIMAGISLVAVLGYPLGVGLVTNKAEFAQGWPLFAILLGGITLSAGYVPFGNILLVAGRPSLHTLLVLSVVLFNVVANALLIPIFSAPGAALATALAFVFMVPLLKFLTRQTLEIRI